MTTFSLPNSTLILDLPPQSTDLDILTSTMQLIILFLYRPFTFFHATIHTMTSIILHLPPTLQFLLLLTTIHILTKSMSRSYKLYLSLGRGGSPPTIWGWWRVTRLKYLAAIPSVLDPPAIHPLLVPYRGYLSTITDVLPVRQGPRPNVVGIAPQRQLTQRAPQTTYANLCGYLQDLATRYPESLTYAPSFLEGHTPALLARPRPQSQPQSQSTPSSSPSLMSSSITSYLPSPRPSTTEHAHEIAHPHLHDGSIHLILHPEDIRLILESGWGERHPLSRGDWWWTFYYHVVRRRRTPVPETLVFVYAPRDDREVEVVKSLVKAGIWWVCGGLEV